MVIWLIGLSGAGKTTIAKQLYKKIKEKHANTVFLDGDRLREAIGKDLGYSAKDRFKSEERTSRLCKLLADQNIHVICAKLSNSPEIREWNKRNILDYREIYVKVKSETLKLRDPKGFYASYEKGEMKNMVGKDIPFHVPKKPFLIVENDNNISINKKISSIVKNLNLNL
jgi:cytidine diphosphoramidate kinase